MQIYLSLLVAAVGLGFFLWAAAGTNAKEVGRIGFWVGLLVFLMQFGGTAATIK